MFLQLLSLLFPLPLSLIVQPLFTLLFPLLHQLLFLLPLYSDYCYCCCSRSCSHFYYRSRCYSHIFSHFCYRCCFRCCSKYSLCCSYYFCCVCSYGLCSVAASALFCFGCRFLWSCCLCFRYSLLFPLLLSLLLSILIPLLLLLFPLLLLLPLLCSRLCSADVSTLLLPLLRCCLCSVAVSAVQFSIMLSPHTLSKWLRLLFVINISIIVTKHAKTINCTARLKSKWSCSRTPLPLPPPHYPTPLPLFPHTASCFVLCLFWLLVTRYLGLAFVFIQMGTMDEWNMLRGPPKRGGRS